MALRDKLERSRKRTKCIKRPTDHWLTFDFEYNQRLLEETKPEQRCKKTREHAKETVRASRKSDTRTLERKMYAGSYSVISCTWNPPPTLTPKKRSFSTNRGKKEPFPFHSNDCNNGVTINRSSPRYKENGWLGVKKQLSIYLPIQSMTGLILCTVSSFRSPHNRTSRR